jgi:predicted transcriptional regulator
MTTEAAAATTPCELLRMRDGLIMHQALHAVAKLGVADLLKDGPRTTPELAGQLEVNESALYRVLRALASKGIFEDFAANLCKQRFVQLSGYRRVPCGRC